MPVLRKPLAVTVGKARLPLVAFYFLLSIPLIIFEEQIDC
jgi:hypothetical protein